MKLAQFIFLLIFPLTALSWYARPTDYFFAIEESKYSENMEIEDLKKLSILNIPCYSPGKRRPVCEEQSTEIEKTIKLTARTDYWIKKKPDGSEEKFYTSYCKVYEYISDEFALTYHRDFAAKNNYPESIDKVYPIEIKGKYICVKKHDFYNYK